MLSLVRVFGGRRRRVVWYGAAALTALFAPAAVCGADADAAVREAAAAAMRRALVSSASWRMERTLPGSERVFVSSGVVDCRVGGSGIEWRTLKPFAALVAMRKDSMVFEDEDGRREKPSGEMSRYDDIRKATDAFAEGRLDAFGDVFDVEIASAPEGRWRAVFKPRVSAMRELVESAEITGGELPESVTIRSGNGATSRISFTPRDR